MYHKQLADKASKIKNINTIETNMQITVADAFQYLVASITKKNGIAKITRRIAVEVNKHGKEMSVVIITFLASCFFPAKNIINETGMVKPNNIK
ncbi:hypothetical protein JN11_02438 [Mucilaginibacter frigoritolerans]|uniref:Uncharacterized protein n=1 Tax=Mucilaginibacter frigoritolerans TaxID=652788 RepID=A0A562U2D7_9SPHI|nr:hypothetical protein [Mucilaginibacter frigoritolerans]TWJ00023.1 hypothetical protein JN11_02438 [Mucilaginibacter frigoritolerans]